MPFQFTLPALLRLRESFEKMELQRLQAIAAQLMKIRAEIELIDAETDTARRDIVEQSLSGISGAELHVALASEEVRHLRRLMLVTKQAEAQEAHKAQMLRYKEARQRREILSNLRERQLSAYEREQARREQQRIDELFLIRRFARKRLSLERLT